MIIFFSIFFTVARDRDLLTLWICYKYFLNYCSFCETIHVPVLDSWLCQNQDESPRFHVSLIPRDSFFKFISEKQREETGVAFCLATPGLGYEPRYSRLHQVHYGIDLRLSTIAFTIIGEL